jgi:hypothetical protein
MKSLVSFLLLSALFMACRSTTPQAQVRRQPFPPALPPVSLDPDVCRIIGTVISVDSIRANRSASDPCSKAPCEALVRVDSVLSYGSSFPLPLSSGQMVHTHFTFTLAPTAEVLPSVKPGYPGASAGSVIRTDLKSLPAFGTVQDSRQTFVVDWYELRN